MTRFIDGPAQGQTLMLRRAVRFLRVTRKRFRLESHPVPHQKADVFDALDQPEDTPREDEELYAYEIQEHRGTCHIRCSRESKKASGFYAMATYGFCHDQPTDAQMRDTTAWHDWCVGRAAKSVTQPE